MTCETRKRSDEKRVALHEKGPNALLVKAKDKGPLPLKKKHRHPPLGGSPIWRGELRSGKVILVCCGAPRWAHLVFDKDPAGEFPSKDKGGLRGCPGTFPPEVASFYRRLRKTSEVLDSRGGQFETHKGSGEK